MMLFLGAGASKSFGLKTMKEMSEEFEKEADLTSEERELYSDIKTTLESNNLERILTVVHDLCVLNVVDQNDREKILSTYSENPSVVYFESKLRWCLDELPKLSSEDIMIDKSKLEDLVKYQNDMQQKLRRTLKPALAITIEPKIINFIKRECNIDKKIKSDSSIKTDIETKYDRLFEILENISTPFNIFTTNYDRIIETYIRLKGKSGEFYDGFTYTDLTYTDPRIGDWEPEGYKEGWKFKLFKLHGSVDQYIENGGIIKCWREPRGTENAMIYPMRDKEVYKDPFFELFNRLKTCLRSDEICVVIGHFFGDKHIQNIFIDAVKSNHKLRIILVDKDPDKVTYNLEPLRDIIKPIKGKFGEEKVFEELKQKLS